jgi:molybdopterin converting factor small subunit
VINSVRVVLPAHLKTLAGVSGEVVVECSAPVTVARVVDALEAAYPALRGTIRDPANRRRRPFIRFFVGEEDLSHHSLDDTLPEDVALSRQPLFVVGAMAGG